MSAGHLAPPPGGPIRPRCAGVFLGILTLAAALLPLSARSAAALAVVNTENGYQYYWEGEYATVKEAQEKVLNACARNAYVERHTERCRVVLSGDGPAYYALVRATNGSIGWGMDEVEWGAVSTARDNCNRLGNCPSNAQQTWYDRIPLTRQIVMPPEYWERLRLEQLERERKAREAAEKAKREKALQTP